MKQGVKRVLFRNFWWVGPLAGALVVALLWRVAADKGTLVLTVSVAVLSVAFFVQQQKLAEIQLFRQLFVDFNGRYDALNGALQRIVRDGIGSDADREAVLDYFNLCAEEYLFFEEGYIHLRVWTAWSNGMAFYFESPTISAIWDEEAKDSYYGFQPPAREVAQR
jgi:hypothetical protein